MKVLHYFERAISLPPKVVVQKIFHKLKRLGLAKKRYVLDKYVSTYALNHSFSGKTLNSFLKNDVVYNVPVSVFNQRLLQHEFDLLGSGWTKVSTRSRASLHRPNAKESSRIRSLIQEPYACIDWQLDFKSGYRWDENTWSEHIQYGDVPGVDVKVPWELARMQHLVSLAWGYQESKELLYKIEFQNQILDFIAANPPRFGVNWSCTMDVGIRVANWLLAYDLFRSFGAIFDSAFEAILIRSVYEHGRHIISHLEYDPFLRSNHYLANIAGLLFTALYLPTTAETKRWLEFSIQELICEVLSQFHPDGSNFEASTSYHRLSAEMVGYATALAKGIAEFPDEYWSRLEKMANFICSITKPDGSIVQCGDNDSGRFIKLLPEDNELDHRYLIGGLCSLKTGDGLTSFMQSQLVDFAIEKSNSVFYPDFGLYLLKNNSVFLAVRCGDIGQKGNGGHAHNDQLSFELCLQGQSVIVDPGTYVYTPFPDARRKFRSSAMHNTLSIAGKEQNEDKGLFRMIDRAHGRLIRFEESVFVGEHEGFGSIHRRELRIYENRLEGIDECAEKGQIYFHFAPNWKGRLLNSKEAEWVYSGLTITVSTDQGSFALESGEVSFGYGLRQDASVLILSTDSTRTAWNITAHS